MGHPAVFKENPRIEAVVESHPCAKNAQGWGTRLTAHLTDCCPTPRTCIRCGSAPRASHAWLDALRRDCGTARASANDWDRAPRAVLCRNCTARRMRDAASLCAGRPPKFRKHKIRWQQGAEPQAG